MANLGRKIRLSKRRHEAARYLRFLHDRPVASATIIASLAPPTAGVLADGTGVFLTPSEAAFKRLGPDTSPCGIVFKDGSFLCVKEVCRYGYRAAGDSEPAIWRSQYTYHYQRPDDCYFFRFDCHPDVGDPATHPVHHLHSAGWQQGQRGLPSVPRFTVPETTLDDVLSLIARDFFGVELE